MSLSAQTLRREFTPYLGWYPLFVVFTWQLLMLNCLIRREARFSDSEYRAR